MELGAVIGISDGWMGRVGGNFDGCRKRRVYERVMSVLKLLTVFRL